MKSITSMLSILWLIFASFAVGYCVDVFLASRNFVRQAGLGMLFSVFIICWLVYRINKKYKELDALEQEVTDAEKEVDWLQHRCLHYMNKSKILEMKLNKEDLDTEL